MDQAVSGQSRDDGGDELTSGSERRSAHRSPWIWRIAGVLAVGVLAVTVGPDLLSSSDPATPHSEASPPGPSAVGDLARGPTEPHDNPLRGWTTRGAQLGAPFVSAALARMRVEGRHVDHVLWAGSLDGRDEVLVVSYRFAPVQRAADDIEIGALRVRRDSEVATARSVTIGYVREPEGLVGVAWRGDDERTRVLVLSSPTPRQVQISPTVDYHPSGDITRRWRDVRLADGVLVTDLGRHVDPTFVVRPKDLSSPTDPILVHVADLAPPPGPDEVAVAGARSPTYAGPGVGVLVDTLGEAMRSYADLRTADVRVVWSGQIAIGRKRSGEVSRVRAALLVVRRQDGATFQAFVYARPADLLGVSTAYPVRWSVADRLPYAFGVSGYFLLISPGGPGSVAITPAVGKSLFVQLDGEGVARVDNLSLDGAGVVVRDPAEHTVLRATLVNTIKADIFGFGL